MARYLKDRSSETLFVDGSLDSLLPASSLVRVIAAALSELDFSAFDAAYCNDETGRPAVEPRRLAGVWIASLLRGNTSSVVLARLCEEDIEFRWLLGDAPVQKSTLCGFRKRHVEALSGLSTQLLAGLARSGQLPGRELVVDGTIIDAASSCHASASRANLRKRVSRLRTLITEKLSAPEPEPDEISALKGQVNKLTSTLAEMDRMGLMADTARITLTEPEASLKRRKRGGYAPAHNVQAVTDAQSGAIVSLDVVDQGNDQGLLGPQVDRALQTLDRVAEQTTAPPGPVERVSADGAYHDTGQLVRLRDQQIQPAVPNGQSNRRPAGQHEAYIATAFMHDPKTDTLTCPAGEVLHPIGLNRTRSATKYRAPAHVCNSCTFKSDCCPNARVGRTVHRRHHSELLSHMETHLQTADGQRMLRARRVTCEGIFARLTGLLHWQRCRTWGRRGAQAEALWRQITHNLMLWTGQWKPIILKT